MEVMTKVNLETFNLIKKHKIYVGALESPDSACVSNTYRGGVEVGVEGRR